MIRSIAVFLVFSYLIFPRGAESQTTRLDKIHEDIQSKYADVRHLSADEFNGLLLPDTIVFDVREEKEYGVSHLSNAVLVSPKISAEDFMAQFGEQVSGKTAVFYCSVGRRSSDLVSRLEANREVDAGSALFNLEGGLFSWVNEQREVSGIGVHPYNWYWGRLIEDKTMINYKPIEETNHD